MKKVAIYARVSTDSQTVENQLQELHAVAQRNGWIVVAVHTDEGISGAKGRDKRPGYDALLTGVARKDYEMIGPWTRSTKAQRSSSKCRCPRRRAKILPSKATICSL